MNLDKWIGKTIPGEQLNQILDGMPLLKFMHDDDIHYGMQYKTGDNLDILSFNTSEGECSPGGLYVTTLKDSADYYDAYGDYARRVRINPNALVYIENKKIKCDEIFLEERILKDDLLEILFTEYIQKLISESNESVEEFIISICMSDDSESGFYGLKYIERKFLTPRMIMRIIKNDGRALQYIDLESRTPELLIAAVNNNGMALGFIGQNERTYELMMAAVKQSGVSLMYIEIADRTPEMMMEAIKQDGHAIQYIEQEYRTMEMMMEAVKQCGDAICHIEQEFRTVEMMMEAVKQSGYAIQYIEQEIRTMEMMMEAVKQSGIAIGYIEQEFRTMEMMMAAVKQNRNAINYIGYKFRTPELSTAAKLNEYKINAN